MIILLSPYRIEGTYLSSGLELSIELSRYCNNPDNQGPRAPIQRYK